MSAGLKRGIAFGSEVRISDMEVNWSKSIQIILILRVDTFPKESLGKHSRSVVEHKTL